MKEVVENNQMTKDTLILNVKTADNLEKWLWQEYNKTLKASCTPLKNCLMKEMDTVIKKS